MQGVVQRVQAHSALCRHKALTEGISLLVQLKELGTFK